MLKDTQPTAPIVTEMLVFPVAGRDSMLLNLSGAHGPFETVALRDFKPAYVRFGSERKSPVTKPMSALPPKADIVSLPRHVRFVPKADICNAANCSVFNQPTFWCKRL